MAFVVAYAVLLFVLCVFVRVWNLVSDFLLWIILVLDCLLMNFLNSGLQHLAEKLSTLGVHRGLLQMAVGL